MLKKVIIREDLIHSYIYELGESMIEFLIKEGDSSNQYMKRILLKETIRSKKVIFEITDDQSF